MIRTVLPEVVKKPLFGDRKKYQIDINDTDLDWIKWLAFYNDFYEKTQKNGLGKIINDWGYNVIKEVNLEGSYVLEIGAGNLPHIKYWNGIPSKYHLVDVDDKFLETSDNRLSELDIVTSLHHIRRGQSPVIDDESLDVIFTFYSLEHIFDLEKHLKFYYSKLKKGGLLIGAIPNEGGLAWGLGRCLTTRRFVHKNTNINYDKVICWEHQNYCDDILKKILASGFQKKRRYGYPFGSLAPKDLNLVTSFIYTKAESI